MDLPKLTPSVLSLLGLVLDITGGMLVSMEAFGIREFLHNVHDASSIQQRYAYMSYVAMVNNASVFMLVNIVWLALLLVVFHVGWTWGLVFFLLGFYVWRTLIRVLKGAASWVSRIGPIYKTGGCLTLLLLLPFVLIHALLIALAHGLYMATEFGLDLPFRFVGEKLIGPVILRVFEKVDRVLDHSSRTYLKRPVLLGGALLLIGFLYQFAGTLLAMHQTTR